MALLWKDGRGLNLQIETAEWETIKRALSKALERAREVGATADQAELLRLMSDLSISTD